ncbi:MAG TPA: phosphate/phosphite/phosphonate ABC transporter substrate-binding protein [Sulfurivirga caldicuralii]|nr:phosphate/phosphite/phosphonate ABC transporter substrate-binding protein [Sulfurivirga caldicuralii]
MNWLKIITAIILLGLLWGCDREEEALPVIGYSEQPPELGVQSYRFAIHPLYSPGRLFEKFAPVVDYLNQQFHGFKLVLEASRDYPAYDEKIRAQQPDFLLPNPFQTLIALRYGYHVIGKVADDSDFRGLILVRKDSPIQKVTDLKGGVIVAPGPTALAATMMPKYYLATHGLDVQRDVRYHYAGTQESTMMTLYLKQADAATTWPVPWRLLQQQRPHVAAQLKVMWQTETLPSNSVMAHERVPASVAKQVMAALVAMGEDPVGRRLLQDSTFTEFVYADDQTYAPVEAFIQQYSQRVEPVEIK